MKRKLLSVLLCLSMVLTFLPSAALAEGSEELTEAQAAMQAFKESYDASSGSVNRTAIFNAVISYDPNVAELKEYYSSITTLDLSNFGLKDTGLLVPFSGLTNLNLSGNSITNPNLAFCPELVTLDLSRNNGLTNPDLTFCPKLVTVDLSENTSLSSISGLAKCTALRELNLSGATSLSDVNALASCTDLAKLDLSGATNLSSITALEHCTNLTTLDLSGAGNLMNIGALEFCTQLATLDLSGTGISNIGALEKCTALKDVNLSGTSLSDFAALAGKQITKLDISKTNADSSSSYGALVNLPLEELNLSGNAKIAVIGPLTTAGNSPACANTLKTLDISGTGMTTLGLWNSQASTPGPSLPNLTTLTAQNLNLTDLGDLAAIAAYQGRKLTEVNLTDSTLTSSKDHTNQVNTVKGVFTNTGLNYTEPEDTAVDKAVEQKEAFQTALGEDNGKEKLTWEILSNAIKWYKDALAYVDTLPTARDASEPTPQERMTELTTYYGSITALDMANKPTEGTIRTSVLEPFTGLETLDLSNTNITEIEGLAECTSLKVLDVSGNDIADISALEDCSSLEELNLSGNKRVKDLRALDGANSLKTLDVSNTGIGTAVAVPDGATSKEIDSLEALSGLSLTSLDISGNAGITDISSLTTTTDDSTHAETASELSKNLASLNISGTGVTDLSSMWKVDADDDTKGEAAFSKLTTLNAEGLTLTSIENLSKVAGAMNKAASASGSGSGSTETVTLNLKDSTLKADEDVAKEIEAITEALKDAATEDGAGFTAPTVNDTGMSDLDVAKAAKDELAKKLSSGVLTCTWDDLFTAVLAYNKVNDSETGKAALTTWYASIGKIDLSNQLIANSMYGGIGADVGVLAPFTGLTELDLSNTGIADKTTDPVVYALGALANMPNLNVLDVSGNPGIIDIGALQNTKLTKLNASNTGIDDEDLGALVGLSLEELDLSHNAGITDIGGLTNPGKDASGNEVTNKIADSLVRLDISATGVTALQSVWDATNEKPAFTKLGTLTATGLKLDSISGLAQIAKPLKDPINVRWDLGGCELKSTLANVDAVNIITDKLGEAAETGSGFVAPNVDEPDTTKLDKAVKWAKRFDAAMGNENGDGGAENLTWDTLITAVYFYKEAVKEVESSGNAADKAQLDNLTQHYASITTLNMSGKNMSKFAISTGALTPFTGLKNLYLANSGIKEIGGLEGLKDLETLDISNNNLTDSGSTKILGALKNHTNLVNLNASDNPNLSDLGALATCTGLKTLNLSNTGTSDSSLGALVGLDLVKLDLSGTQITDVGGLTSNGEGSTTNKITQSLTTLDISNTKVTKLESVWDATNSKPAFPQLTDLTAKNLVLSSFTGLVNIVTDDSFSADNQTWTFTGTTLVPAEGGPTSEQIKQHIDAINNAFSSSTTGTLTDFPNAGNVHEHVFATSWSKNPAGHWHACTASGCPVTDVTQLENYAAHTFDGGTVTTPPSASSAGVRTYRCTVCGYEKTETIPATGVPAASYTITATTDGRGVITSSTGSWTVNEGGSLTATVTPNAGYRISYVLVDNASVAVSDLYAFSYRFDQVTADHTIFASFTPVSYPGVPVTPVTPVTPNPGVTAPSRPSETPDTPSTPEDPGATPSTPPANPTVHLPFVDVLASDWYNEAVKYVYGKGIMNGTDTARFSPSATTTRGMIVTILYRLEGEPGAGASTFADVPAGQWYTNAVAWAAANSIVGGYGDGRFGPNDTITREQLAAILYRYARYKGYDTIARANLSGYTDAGQISAYALEPMQWAASTGLINGVTETTLAPTGSATRAQVAAILMRFCENIAK